MNKQPLLEKTTPSQAWLRFKVIVSALQNRSEHTSNVVQKITLKEQGSSLPSKSLFEKTRCTSKQQGTLQNSKAHFRFTRRPLEKQGSFVSLKAHGTSSINSQAFLLSSRCALRPHQALSWVHAASTENMEPPSTFTLCPAPSLLLRLS